MPLHVGALNPVAVYVGSTLVSRVMLGSTQAWPDDTPPPPGAWEPWDGSAGDPPNSVRWPATFSEDGANMEQTGDGWLEMGSTGSGGWPEMHSIVSAPDDIAAASGSLRWDTVSSIRILGFGVPETTAHEDFTLVSNGYQIELDLSSFQLNLAELTSKSIARLFPVLLAPLGFSAPEEGDIWNWEFAYVDDGNEGEEIEFRLWDSTDSRPVTPTVTVPSPAHPPAHVKLLLFRVVVDDDVTISHGPLDILATS